MNRKLRALITYKEVGYFAMCKGVVKVISTKIFMYRSLFFFPFGNDY